MRHIRIGSIVRAKGEGLLRRVLAIKDDHARCAGIDGGPVRWYSLSQLAPGRAAPKLKTYLL